MGSSTEEKITDATGLVVAEADSSEDITARIRRYTPAEQMARLRALIREHMLNCIQPNGCLYKLGEIVDRQGGRLETVHARASWLTIVVAALSGLAVGFSAVLLWWRFL